MKERLCWYCFVIYHPDHGICLPDNDWICLKCLQECQPYPGIIRARVRPLCAAGKHLADEGYPCPECAKEPE